MYKVPAPDVVVPVTASVIELVLLLLTLQLIPVNVPLVADALVVSLMPVVEADRPTLCQARSMVPTLAPSSKLVSTNVHLKVAAP